MVPPMDLSLKVPSHKLYFIITIAMRLFPSRHINLYLVTIALLCVYALFLDGSFLQTLPIKVGFLASSLSIAFGLIRLPFSSDPFRDLTEPIRILVYALFIVVAFQPKYSRITSLPALFASFLIINFAVSYCQVTGLANVSALTTIYANPYLVEDGLGPASRALGLMPGPGANAAISSILGTWLFTYYYSARKKKPLSLLILLVTFLIVLLCQSQTSFIALGATIFVILLSFAFSGELRLTRASGYLVISAFAAIALYIFHSISNYRYLFTLFTHGLERNSFLARQDKWLALLHQADQHPFMYFIGHGKSFYGQVSSAMDNEYLFFFLVHGFFISVIIYFCLALALVRASLEYFRGTIESLPFIAATLTGLILSSTSSFLQDPKSAFAYIVILSLWSSRNSRLKLA
jgi:hypothetical protein